MPVPPPPPQQWQNKTDCGHPTEGCREGRVVTTASLVGGRCTLVIAVAQQGGGGTLLLLLLLNTASVSNNVGVQLVSG